MLQRCSVPATLALMLASGALAVPPVVDGKKTTTPTDDTYGAAKWVNPIPTNFGDSQPSPNAGNPEAVTTGVELVIPLASLGLTTPTNIKVSCFVASGDCNNLSNQWLGGLNLNTGNLGTPSTTDMNTIGTGGTAAQWITLPTPNTASPAQTIDGRRDEPDTSNPYGAITLPSPRVQTNYTGYGDATHGQRGGNAGNGALGNEGSEIDAIYARRSNGNLYLFIAGNIEANGNKLIIAIDTGAAGQSQLAGLADGQSYAALNGLTFDTGFAPRYIVGVNVGEVDRAAQPGVFNMYVDFMAYDGAAWTFNYCGRNQFSNAGALTNTTGTLSEGDAAAPVIRAAVDNSNITGVVGAPVILTGDRDIATGSEIDAVYSRVENGKLYLLLTGNLKTDYTKLDLFFDAGPTAANPVRWGQNRLRGASQAANPVDGTPRYRGNVDVDFNGLNRQGADTLALVDVNDPSQGRVPVNGLKFEDDFQATYMMIVTNGNSGPVQTYTNAATLRPNGRREVQTTDVSLDYGAFDGGAKPDNDPMDWNGTRADVQDFTINDLFANYAPRFLSDTLAPDPNNSNLMIPNTTNAGGKITAAIDNSNTAGVTATTADNAAAAAVSTGVEIAIDLAELGWDGSAPIKLAGWLNSSGHDAISNQVIGGIPAAATPPTAGLGEPRNVDLSAIAGTQYIVLYTPGPVRCNAADVAQLGGTAGPDGQNTVDDLIFFLSQFFAGNVAVADIAVLGGGAGQDGQITADDLVLFLSQFFSPCNP